MSKKLDNYKIGKEKDRRIKIPASEHKRIKELHASGQAIRAIARLYKVDKRLIQFILYPERQQKNLQDRASRGGWKQYYNKDKWKKVMREHRNYKRSLIEHNA